MHNLELQIRPVRTDEAEKLLLFAESVFRHAFEHLNEPDHFEAYMSEAYTLPQFQAELANPQSAFFFALLGDEIAGYIKLNWGTSQTELQDQPGLELQRIYVNTELQGKKIGQALLNHCIQFGKERAFPFLWLGVWEKNEAAQRFYQRHGFLHFDSHTFMVGTDAQTDLLMKLTLK
ncbi:MAG: GNAT family N-acetyltransferase [Sphingobacteriaceae bacterium]